MFSGDNTFFISLRSIIKKMHQISDSELRAFGISHAEMRIMLLLYDDKDNCRQDELYSAMGIDRTNVGRSLKKLEGHGLIIREKDSDDAKSFRVLLTDKGYGLKKDLERLKNDIESTVTAGISAKDFKSISTILETMDKNLIWERHKAMKKKFNLQNHLRD